MKLESQDYEKVVNLIIDKIKGNMSLENDSLNHSEYGIFSTMDMAIEKAYIAQKELVKFTFDFREKIIISMKEEFTKNIDLLSQMAVEETGMGNYEHKRLKNKLVVDKTPGTEDLRAEAYTGDYGLTLLELSPFGVIGSITPTTNPSETILCNAIGMIAAGNSIVFSPHPRAKNTSIKTIEILNMAIQKCGGPKNLITTVKDPSVENVNIMMKHPKINMLCVTGGPGVVKIALSSGKKAIGAGAGNPPCVVDETADIEKAGKDIIDGCTFDNNLPCTSEKEVIVLDEVCDHLISSMKRYGAFELKGNMIDKLKELIIEDDHPNKDFIGKSAQYILNKLGVSYPDGTRCIICETKLDHIFVMEELMMPVLPIVRAKNISEAIDMAVICEKGNRHTAMMHSKNIDNLTKMARTIQTTIFVKNAPSYAGIGFLGEGYCTFTIAGPTGEGLTSARVFARRRRCVLSDGFFIK